MRTAEHRLAVEDPEILKVGGGAAADDNVLAASPFIANAHNARFRRGKVTCGKKCKG